MKHQNKNQHDLPATQWHTRRRSSLLIAIACTLLATSCSGPLVMGTIYNGAAKRSAKQMKSFAKFSQSQKNTIDQRFAQFHSWHRQQQLPLYSQLLTKVANHLEAELPVSTAVTASWIQQAADFSMQLRVCSPLNASAEFLGSLSDSQVTSIEQKTNSTHNERVQKYHRESKRERALRRQEEIINWAGRAGLKFNNQQKELLAQTLDQQISLGSQRYYLQEQWINKFNKLLKNRNQANSEFTSAVNGHIALLWTLTQDNYPTEWLESTSLWENFFTEYLTLQTARQNLALIKKTRKLAATVDTLSTETKNLASPRCFSPSG